MIENVDNADHKSINHCILLYVIVSEIIDKSAFFYVLSEANKRIDFKIYFMFCL